ncbi:MAG TPA: hypothetical protein VMY05_04635 [Acidobacteriota bacterium]|nr:hypothetical protein [Acidobacteriota bacterium]
MANEDFKLLIQSLGGRLTKGSEDGVAVVHVLMTETVKFRDKLKEETGEILTVGDTRVALDALECRLNGKPLPEGLTPEQAALAQIYVDRLTLFKG